MVLPWWQDQCVFGDAKNFVKGNLQVPNLWLVFIGTRLTHMKVASFEKVEFHFPRCAHGTKPRAENPNLDDVPTSKHENKIVHHVPPKNDHDSRWLFGKNSHLLFCKWEMFLLLDMGMFFLLSLMAVSCLWHMKWQLGWSLIAFVLILWLCWQVWRRKENLSLSNICISFIELGCFAITRQMISLTNLHSISMKSKSC